MLSLIMPGNAYLYFFLVSFSDLGRIISQSWLFVAKEENAKFPLVWFVVSSTIFAAWKHLV